ncbi:hypothetical protein F5B22DRAFT_226152 [Xylaria bambusicola]|uniref:uncharacterized protein n=1 Tax=Xylaria bambusicola TaxID=326684 RepID=UPI0020072809|nr:uncharacterized protein F5B22DRAFT_226152 [Xylaria bambusicola]KAI0514651.1 hypothetical protein F5B22DRAFT_226152 [Xylaria bambusicola]
MPVTIKIAQHDANPVSGKSCHTGLTSEALLIGAAPAKRPEVGTIIQSSYPLGGDSNRAISPCDNRLVRTIFQAYTSHHHLILRPEDIWFAILTQFSFHVNANAEALRHKFVAHDGKVGLILRQYFDSLATIDYGDMCTNMTRLIEANITDPSLRAWIMPSWTTTTKEDVIVASVCMMGTLQRYFEYVFDACMCGIPTATLLGDRADWVDLASRVERLGEYGEEPQLFRDVLRPVVRGFVETFDNPADERVRDFWSRAIDHQRGSGMNHLSGWITAFLIWDEEGKFRITKRLQDRAKDAAQKAFAPDSSAPLSLHPLSEIGWAGYRVDLNQVPAGFVSVPVKLKNPETEVMVDTQLLAGSVAMEALTSEPPQQESSDNGARYTVKPVTGWWMYQVKGGELEGKNTSLKEFLKSRKDKWTGSVTGTVYKDGFLHINRDA